MSFISLSVSNIVRTVTGFRTTEVPALMPESVTFEPPVPTSDWMVIAVAENVNVSTVSENVMLSSAGHVRLVDFGFAVPLNADGDSITGGCGTAM
jgi:serine/threonine protein kinase